MTNGKRNRAAGHSWELDVVRLLRERGIYPKAITTRNGSRALDALGIDAMNQDEPKNGVMEDTIQCKTTIGGVNYHTLISAMLKSGRTHPAIFHRRTERVTETRINVLGHYVTSQVETYLELMACRQAIKRIKALGVDGTHILAINQILKELGL